MAESYKTIAAYIKEKIPDLAGEDDKMLAKYGAEKLGLSESDIDWGAPKQPLLPVPETQTTADILYQHKFPRVGSVDTEPAPTPPQGLEYQGAPVPTGGTQAAPLPPFLQPKPTPAPTVEQPPAQSLQPEMVSAGISDATGVRQPWIPPKPVTPGKPVSNAPSSALLGLAPQTPQTPIQQPGEIPTGFSTTPSSTTAVPSAQSVPPLPQDSMQPIMRGGMPATADQVKFAPKPGTPDAAEAIKILGKQGGESLANQAAGMYRTGSELVNYALEPSIKDRAHEIAEKNPKLSFEDAVVLAKKQAADAVKETQSQAIGGKAVQEAQKALQLTPEEQQGKENLPKWQSAIIDLGSQAIGLLPYMVGGTAGTTKLLPILRNASEDWWSTYFPTLLLKAGSRDAAARIASEILGNAIGMGAVTTNEALGQGKPVGEALKAGGEMGATSLLPLAGGAVGSKLAEGIPNAISREAVGGGIAAATGGAQQYALTGDPEEAAKGALAFGAQHYAGRIGTGEFGKTPVTPDMIDAYNAAIKDINLGKKPETPLVTPHEDATNDNAWNYNVGNRKVDRMSITRAAKRAMKDVPSLTSEQAYNAALSLKRHDITDQESIAHYNEYLDDIRKGGIEDKGINHYHLHGDEMAFTYGWIDEKGQQQLIDIKGDINSFGTWNDTPGFGHEKTNLLNTDFQALVNETLKKDTRLENAKTSEEKVQTVHAIMSDLHDKINKIEVRSPSGNIVKMSASFGMSKNPAKAEDLLNTGKEKIGNNSISIDNELKKEYNINDKLGVDRTEEYWNAGLRSKKLEQQHADIITKQSKRMDSDVSGGGNRIPIVTRSMGRSGKGSGKGTPPEGPPTEEPPTEPKPETNQSIIPPRVPSEIPPKEETKPPEEPPADVTPEQPPEPPKTPPQAPAKESAKPPERVAPDKAQAFIDAKLPTVRAALDAYNKTGDKQAAYDALKGALKTAHDDKWVKNLADNAIADFDKKFPRRPELPPDEKVIQAEAAAKEPKPAEDPKTIDDIKTKEDADKLAEKHAEEGKKIEDDCLNTGGKFTIRGKSKK